MKKISRRSFLAATGLTAVAAALTACGGGSASGTEAAGVDGSKPVTLKILFKGPKTDGWDDVYQEFLNRTKDTLNIELDVTFVEHADYKDKLNLEMTSGANYDLVFDAPWVHLKELAADGYYADLSSYFGNDAYPGLKKCFSDSLMNANRWYGQMCYIPLLHAYGNGIPTIYYRADLAEQWGIGELQSMDDLEAYWAKAKENGMIPLSARDTRGFFQMYTINGAYPDTAERANSAASGIQGFAIANCVFYAYIQNGKIVSIAMEGSGDENFADFPAGYNYDFGVDRYTKFAEWQSKGYLSADSMTCKDENTPFWSGQAASGIGAMDEYEKHFNGMATYDPSAKLGVFVYIDSLRTMQPHAYPTGFGSNNGLAIPASSKNIDSTMKFLDWMYQSEENHDLFELGIEGTDWEAVGDDQFTDLSGYASAFPGYGLTWNPNYVKFSSVLPEDALSYRKYETEEETYLGVPVVGFSFNGTSSEMSTYTAQVKAVADMVATTKMHGILSDGTQTYSSMKEMLKVNTDACYAAGADKIQEELFKQLTEYLAAQA